MDRQISKKEQRRASLRKMLPYLIGGVIVIAGIVIGITTISPSVNINELRLSEVQTGNLTVAIPATGKVVPLNEQILTSPVSSRIVKIYRQPGDSVTAGEPLIELDLESVRTEYEKMLNDQQIKRESLKQLDLNNSTGLNELELQIQVKEMELKQLAIEEANERRLDSLGSGTGDRVRQAESARLTASLELDHMRQRLANERLRTQAARRIENLGVESFEKDIRLMERTLSEGRIPAPYSGILTYITTEIGRNVGAGEKLAVVADLTRYRIEGELGELSAARVNAGSDVSIRIGSTELEGTLTNINPQAQGGSISIVVMPANPSDQHLRSGRRVELDINEGFKDGALMIANGTYYKGAGEYELFVLDGDDTLTKRKVRLGDSNRRMVEVLSGLATGDKVVVSDMSNFADYNSLTLKEK